MFDISSTRVTRGFVQNNLDSPPMISGLGLLTLMPSRASVALSPGFFVSVPTYDQNIGTIALQAILGTKSIKLTVTPDFPEDYMGYFAVLRGRFEYKTDPTNATAKIVYESNDFNPEDDIEIVDSDIIPGCYYYYSIIALIGSEAESLHYEYNPSTGFVSGYAYDNHSHSEFLFSILPEEWRVADDSTVIDGDDRGLTERYLGIAGAVFDSIKTDYDSILKQNDIWECRLEYLEALGSKIGWKPNNELPGELRRTELENVTNNYKRKGRNYSIEYLSELVTGWDISFEPGWRRLHRANDFYHRTPSFDDSYMIQNLHYPELTEGEYGLTSTGLADQTFELPFVRIRFIIVEVYNSTTEEWEEWLEVEDVSLEGASDVYHITEDADLISTVVFGDGINGNIPDAGSTIRVTFVHGGDSTVRTPAGPPSWYGLTGYRVLLQNLDEDAPLTETLLGKIDKIVEEFKPSYGVYEMLLGPLSAEEVFAPFDDSDTFEDDIFDIVFILSNTVDHHSNSATYRTPVIV